MGTDRQGVEQAKADPRISPPNQSPPLVGIDLFSTNLPLSEALDRDGAGAWRPDCVELGTLAGRAEILELGTLANDNPPQLKTFDRYGNRIDEVAFHPAYHRLMELATERGLHSLPWTEGRGGHAARAAMFMTWGAGRGGAWVSDLDDLRGRAGAARQPLARRPLGAAPHQDRLRPAADRPGSQERSPRRHGDDREAGWLRRPGEH